MSKQDRDACWELVVKCLRNQLMQGNSHIRHIDMDEWIDDEIVDIITQIRKVPNLDIRKKVKSIKGKELWVPKQL